MPLLKFQPSYVINRQPLDLVLSQINPFHTIPAYFFKLPTTVSSHIPSDLPPKPGAKMKLIYISRLCRLVCASVQTAPCLYFRLNSFRLHILSYLFFILINSVVLLIYWVPIFFRCRNTGKAFYTIPLFNLVFPTCSFWKVNLCRETSSSPNHIILVIFF